MKRSDPGFADTLVKAYDAAAAGKDADDPDHPRFAVNGWMQQAQDAVDPNATIQDQEIEGDPTSPISPAAANRSHGRTAIDSNQIALDELRIRQSGSSDPEALIRLARLKRGHDPVGVSRMEKVIRGYGRLP